MDLATNSDAEVKKNMTDEERLELAAKLDRELEEFIDGLEKRRYDEGWPEDRWEEEMDKHPFFMKKAPAPGEELSPLMVGLQQIKFDAENNTPEELAQKYKEDGTFEFKHKNYRLAIINYTEALKLKPDYAKARRRAIDCAYNLKNYEYCIELCDEFLSSDNASDVLNIRLKAVEAKHKKERDQRRKEIKEKKVYREVEMTLEKLNARKIKFLDKKLYCGNLPHIPQPKYEPLLSHEVHIENGCIHWPTLFLYPEFLTSDCLQSVSELSTINACLEQIFEEEPDWDKKKEYKPDNLNVYFENLYSREVFIVDKNLKLQDVVTKKDFIVYDGTLTFYIVPKNSQAEKEFKQQRRIGMF